MKTWVEKYRPEKIKDVVGNPSSIKNIMAWVNEWQQKTPKKKAVLLHGPAGVGKTSIAYAIANELGYDRIELNASDIRTKNIINRIVGSASSQGTFDPSIEDKIIIIDEVDGIHGKYDSGGMSALKKWIKEAKHPLILIANDAYALPPEIRKMTQMVGFKKINQRTIIKVLKEVVSKEKISTDEKVLKIIATNANGDLRSALNDLQALAQGKEKITIKNISTLAMRDSEIKIFDTLARILKSSSPERAREAVSDSSEDADTVLKWLVENVALEYKDSEDLATAYNYLSRSDVFLGRIKRRQDWGLLKYVIDLMSMGVSISKTRKYKGFVRYQYPKTFILMAQNKKKKTKMNALASKMMERDDSHQKLHGSRKIIREEFFPLLETVFKNDPEKGARISSELEFDLEDIDLFLNEKEKSQKILERAQKITDERIRRQTLGEKSKQISLFEF